jgi:hypothetical protein
MEMEREKRELRHFIHPHPLIFNEEVKEDLIGEYFAMGAGNKYRVLITVAKSAPNGVHPSQIMCRTAPRVGAPVAPQTSPSSHP